MHKILTYKWFLRAYWTIGWAPISTWSGKKQLIFAGSDPFAFLTYIKKAILGKIFIPILISIYNHNDLL